MNSSLVLILVMEKFGHERDHYAGEIVKTGLIDKQGHEIETGEGAGTIGAYCD